jgi:hypothetical protein
VWAGVAGWIAFTAAWIVGGQLEDGYLGSDAAAPGVRAGYEPAYHFVSELAARDSGVRALMTAGFYVLGIGTLVFAWAARALRPALLAVWALVAVSGIGVIGAGTFACDPGCPPDGTSTSDALHNAFSFLTFGGWLIGMAVAAWRLRGGRHAWLFTGLLVIALPAALVLAPMTTDRSPDDPVGLIQRIVLLAVAAWFVATAVWLRRTPKVT